MVFVLPLLLVFLFKSILVWSDEIQCPDYYWRDYYGIIPDDAIPAGRDHNNDTRYIGLVYIRGFELLPGTIFPKQQEIRTSAYGKVFNTDKFVKILCSPNKENFQWVAIHSRDLHKYMNRNPVPGGSEVGENLYVGRVFRNGDVVIGKIFRHSREGGNGIGFALENSVDRSLLYDILLYNCEKVDTPEFDTRLGI